MGSKKIRHRFFVLFRGKGTCGIHQPSAGTHQLGRGMEDFRLTAGAHLHRFLTPVGHGGFFFSEHTFPGAGRIHQHPVKKTGIALRQIGRVFIGHQRIADRHALDVPGQNLRPFGIDLIAQQESFTLHPACDLGGLAAGRGTEVTYFFPRLGIQQGNRCHGTGLL